VDTLRDILGQYLDRSGLSRQLQIAELERVWDEMLGEATSHTELSAIRAGVVTFTVDNSALLAELNNFRKVELLAGLRTAAGGQAVRELKFRPGRLRGR